MSKNSLNSKGYITHFNDAAVTQFVVQTNNK